MKCFRVVCNGGEVLMKKKNLDGKPKGIQINPK